MPKGSKYEDMAREAAERIDGDRDLRRQLSLLPDEAGGALVEAGDGGRKPRGPGKALSQMREWLAARGHRMPEDVLVQMAGMAAGQPADAIEAAMVAAERILSWAKVGSLGDLGEDASDELKGMVANRVTGARLSTFMQVYTLQLRAAEALLPYGTPKAGPDEAPQAPAVLVVPASALREASDPASSARDVTPVQRPIGDRMRPPPMPGEIQRNQGLAGEGSEGSDA